MFSCDFDNSSSRLFSGLLKQLVNVTANIDNTFPQTGHCAASYRIDYLISILPQSQYFGFEFNRNDKAGRQKLKLQTRNNFKIITQLVDVHIFIGQNVNSGIKCEWNKMKSNKIEKKKEWKEWSHKSQRCKAVDLGPKLCLDSRLCIIRWTKLYKSQYSKIILNMQYRGSSIYFIPVQLVKYSAVWMSWVAVGGQTVVLNLPLCVIRNRAV